MCCRSGDVDSWIASSGSDGFTPSEEHCMLMPVRTLTVSLSHIHIRRGCNAGDMWYLKWADLYPSVLDGPRELQERLSLKMYR